MANSHGTLSADKVTLRMFEFLRFYFGGFFKSIATDFSSEAADFNQDVVSRIPLVPTVQRYSKEDGYESTDMATKDITVKLDQHAHVTLEVDIETQTETSRNLLDEQVAPAAYAMGLDMLGSVFELITPANFEHEVVESLANVQVSTLSEMRKEMNKEKVPPFSRYSVLNSDAFDLISDDNRVVNVENFARNEEVNRALGHLTNLRGFGSVHEYPDLPETNNLIGFGGTRDALVLSARLPRDPAALVSGLPLAGRVDITTDPETGLSMQRRWWYDFGKGKLFMSFVWMFGVSVGVDNNLFRLVTEATGD